MEGKAGIISRPFEFGIFNIIDNPKEAETISYMSFVMTAGAATSNLESPFSGYQIERSIGPSEGYEEPRSVAIKLKKQPIEKVTETLPVPLNKDPEDIIRCRVSELAFNLLIQCADENYENFLANENVPLDIDLTDEPDKKKAYRKLISRILAASNVIATKYRRGPGQYVLVNKEVYQYLFFSDFVSFGYAYDPKFYAPDGCVGGLKFFISPVEDKIVVGRCGKNEEDGIYIGCQDPTLEDYLGIPDINAVIANYSITKVGTPQVISFNAKI